MKLPLPFQSLKEHVAYYLYILSKDVDDSAAGLYRAAGLALLNEPVHPNLLEEAGKRLSNDDPLYRLDVPDLEEAWPVIEPII